MNCICNQHSGDGYLNLLIQVKFLSRRKSNCGMTRSEVHIPSYFPNKEDLCHIYFQLIFFTSYFTTIEKNTTFISEIYTKPPKKNRATNKTDV